MDDDRYRLVNSHGRVNMIDPPAEVMEREITHLLDSISDPTTVAVFAVVVQRPVEEFGERLCVHTQFIPVRVGAQTLLDIAGRSLAGVTAEMLDHMGEEQDDG